MLPVERGVGISEGIDDHSYEADEVVDLHAIG